MTNDFNNTENKNRFEIECISFDKNDIFRDMIKQLQSKEVFLVSLHERFENKMINENTPPLLVMPCPNQNVLDNVCDLLNELHEEIEYLTPLSNENSQYIDDMEDDIITFKQKAERLEKENEQLKYHLNRTEKELQEYKDFMSLG